MPIKMVPKADAAYAFPLLIKHLLTTPLRCASEQQIVYKTIRRHSYAQMGQRISKLGNALSQLSVEAGDCVAVMDWDSHRYLEAYFAVPMIGAILQTVNIRMSSEQVLYSLQHAEADVILVNEDFLPMLLALLPELPRVKHLILLSDLEQPEAPLGFSGEYEALLAAASADYDFPDFDENAIATRFYTTGTTGRPKCVSFSHRQLVLYTLATLGAFSASPRQQSLGPDDVYMPITPMFHVHAWGLPFVATLMGIKQVYPGRYEANTLLELKQREAVTFSHCVPTILQMLLDSREKTGIETDGWKMVIGGAALTPRLAKSALDAGIEAWSGGGMSETCAATFLTRLKPGVSDEESLALRCRTGMPLPLIEVRVVDDQMQDVPHDGRSTGELVVRAPWLTQAYAGDLPASDELWRGGYLHTQDIGFMTADGYVQITDRMKDVIKSGGEWISSLELESLITSRPGVLEAAVIGVPNDRWGERPVALIVEEAHNRVDPALIITFLTQMAAAGTISRYAVPERVVVVDALVRTSVGKIDKKKLREMYAH